MVEMGSGQGGEVSQLFRNAGFNAPTIEKDLAGLDRVVLTHQFYKDLENEPKA
jgi:methylase of polypeptide subunit release factors